MAYNDQVVRNEEEKLKLQIDIDTSIVELEQLRTLAKELSDQLEHKKGTYKGLKSEIKKLDFQADDLKQQLKEKEDQLDMQEELLMQKKLEIQHLEKATGEKAPDFDSDLMI